MKDISSKSIFLYHLQRNRGTIELKPPEYIADPDDYCNIKQHDSDKNFINFQNYHQFIKSHVIWQQVL
jgi:hypothetical protein